MTTGDTGFAGSIPQIYDRYLVPLIFAPYAADVAARVQALQPSRVLEIAAGTGVVTRELARTLTADIVATDLNQPMLDQAIASIALYNRMFARPFVTVEQAQRIREDKSFSHEEAARDFGFDPRTFEEGVRMQVAQCLY